MPAPSELSKLAPGKKTQTNLNFDLNFLMSMDVFFLYSFYIYLLERLILDGIYFYSDDLRMR